MTLYAVWLPALLSKGAILAMAGYRWFRCDAWFVKYSHPTNTYPSFDPMRVIFHAENIARHACISLLHKHYMLTGI
jgi:hypothetical protein